MITQAHKRWNSLPSDIKVLATLEDTPREIVRHWMKDPSMSRASMLTKIVLYMIEKENLNKKEK
jgi:hypothetical protein